jgi:HK97 family phage major capsid protein
VNRLKSYQDRKAVLFRAMEDVLAKADADGHRDLTEEETKTYEAHKAEMAALAPKVAREEELIAHEKSLSRFPPLGTEADHWPGQIGNPEPAWKQDPCKGFKTPREFLTAIMTAGASGRCEDERLRFLATAGSDEAGGYADPYGGFAIPSGFMPQLLQLAAEADPTAGRTTRIPMTAPKVTIPARTDKNHSSSVSGGMRMYRRGETQTVTASRMELEQVELSATPLMGISYATEELLTDSPISFAALIEAGFRDEYAAKILDEKINGTGAGQYEGVINAPCTVSVSKETGQDADSIAWENIKAMRARCWRYQDAIWLYNHDCLKELMGMVIGIGTAGVLAWQTSAREDAPDLLLGRPAYATEFCATIGDTGDIILGNWSQYLEGVLQGLESAESMHVRFINNERTFRVTARQDGRCWWRSALTPKHSSTTLSPFVILAERA